MIKVVRVSYSCIQVIKEIELLSLGTLALMLMKKVAL